MLSSSAASAFLLGRLAQEGQTPLAMLRVTPGRWRGLTAVPVFAVSEGRLWLAEPRLLGDPSVASVPLSEVGEIRLRTRSGREIAGLDIELGGRVLHYTALDDLDACRAFVAAVRSSRPRE